MPLLIAAVAALAAAAVGVVLVAYVLAWRVIRPGLHTYWDEYTFLPSDMGVPYETVRFTTPDNLQLVAWLMRRPESTATIIVGSGYRDRKTSLLPVAASLWRQGFNVFLLDFRNQGSSMMDSVQTMGWREIGDMLTALGEVAQRLPNTRIGAMGWSMGAVVGLFAAARDQRIAAVVADSAYAVQTHVIAYNFTQATHLPAFPFVPLAELFIYWRAGYRPGSVRTEDVVSSIAPRPLLFIHGEHDDMCPVEDAYRLHARAREPKELWISPRAKHVGVYFADPDAYVRRVGAFFRQHLLVSVSTQDQ